MPKKTPWQEEEEEEKDKDNIIDDDANDGDHEATASETLLSKPSRRETTTNNTNNIPFSHPPPHSSKRQQRHHHHHQTRLILLLLLTSILILCPSIFLLGFALGSSRQTPPQSNSIINDDEINDNDNITNQPCFSHPSKPSPIPFLHPLHLVGEKETPPFPPTLSLHQKIFNGSFFHETKFRAKASPEVDRVWDSLGINCTSIPIPNPSSAKKVNRLIFVFSRSKYPHPTTPRATSRFETESTCPCKEEIWRRICGEFGGVASFALSCMFDAFMQLILLAFCMFFRFVSTELVLTYSIFGGVISSLEFIASSSLLEFPVLS